MKHIPTLITLLALLIAALPACTATPAGAPQAAANRPTLRIKAGLDEPLTDSKGVLWSPDTGSEGGTKLNRPDLPITGTDRPELYRAEHYSMDDYTFKIPNGKYLLKLHFSEDYDGIQDPSQRIFSYAVKDGDPNSKTLKEIKDFSPWKAAGDHFKAYVESIPVTITAGQISITFQPQVENPQINAIEIIPN